MYLISLPPVRKKICSQLRDDPRGVVLCPMDPQHTLNIECRCQRRGFRNKTSGPYHATNLDRYPTPELKLLLVTLHSRVLWFYCWSHAIYDGTVPYFTSPKLYRSDILVIGVSCGDSIPVLFSVIVVG